MKDQREIYSIADFINVLKVVLPEQLGVKDVVLGALSEEVERQFKYINWERFKDANCPGCVSGPNDCDIAYGRGEYRGSFAKIVNGKIQACPCRCSGTTVFGPRGMQSIDIADHKFNVVEPIKPMDENR